MRIFRFSVKNCFHKNLTQTVKHSQNCNRLITHEQGFTLSKTVIQLSQAFPGDDEGFDSQDRDRNYSTEEGGWSPNGSPSQTVCYGPDKDTENEYRSYLRNDLPQFRTSEIRILKRATEQLLLQDISDDEDEVQMTRLDKPSLCIVKRGGEIKPPTVAKQDREKSVQEAKTSHPPAPVKPPKEKKLRKEGKSSKKEKDVKEKKQTVPPPNPGPAPAPAPIAIDTPPASEKTTPAEEVLPAPPPQENVWAKRKEERESLEREKEKSLMPRVMQQAIEQHFPMVHDAATIKVNKESTRKSSDTEFTRAAIRARKQATSNDVRRLMNSESSAKMKMNRMGNQENYGSEEKVNGKQNGGFTNGYKAAQNGALRNNQTNGRFAENSHRERKDSHRSNVSSHHSDDAKKHMNGHSKKKETEKLKENGDVKKFNIEDCSNVNIESWADEMENMDGFEEVNSKKKKNKTLAEKQNVQQSKSQLQNHTQNQSQNQSQDHEKNSKTKPKDPKQGTRLFVPKALRKEADDLPANGLLSPQSVETKEKIAAAKSNGDVFKSDEQSKGFWDSLTPEVSTIPKKMTKKPEGQHVEFPKPVGKSLDITGYDFTFDPQLQITNPIISDRVAIQQMLSAENAATDDDSHHRRNVLNELRQSIDELGPVAMAKVSQEYNEVFSCRPNNNNVSLAPFSNHYSSFQPLFNTGDAPLLYPTAAPSPPMSYLNMMNFSNLKRQSGYGAPENGLLGRIPNSQAAAAAAVVAAQQQRIWNGGAAHFDINSLAGTPPANYSSNGSYGFFNNGSNANEHRAPFGGLPNGMLNGMGNGQAPYFDRTTLPPANLAVGSQRQFSGNMNRQQQQQQQQQQSSGQSHPMNGMGNSNGGPQFPQQNFTQPPPPVMRFPPSNGTSHQDNGPFFFNNGNRAPIGRPPGLSAAGHSAQLDMIWSNSNNSYFGNAGHSNSSWNGGAGAGAGGVGGVQAAGPLRQNGYNQRQVRDNQQMNNRMRPTPVQGNRQ
nr:hypothetical protein F52G3.1 - Caenorhabditis elegans [Caenorhabditis elegans]